MSDLIYLSDRKLIEISGEDRVEFLQGLITNDVTKLSKEKPLFAAFLTPQGKFLCDFYLYQQGDKIIVNINEIFLADFIKKLKIYKLRSKVEIAEIEGFVYFDKKSKTQILLDEKQIEAGNLTDYHKFRIDHNITDGAYDLTVDKSFILEFGYDKKNAIDFEKGCYIGQEVITRTYRRGVIRKAVYKINLSGNVDRLEKNFELKKDGKKLGVVTSFYQEGDNIVALALLRKEEMEKIDGLIYSF